jgi:hypothetical protein
MDLIETVAVRKHCHARSVDRAAIVAVAVLQILETAPAAERCEAVAAYLRDEFSDIARNAINEAPAP